MKGNKNLEEAMEAIRMVLDAGYKEGLNGKKLFDSIDWAWLERLDNQYTTR